MVSDVGAGAMEGWQLGIDEVSVQDICQPGAVAQDKLPFVFHYCQRYMLGKWFIGKYKLPKDFISCESPLLVVPPPNIATTYDFAISPGNGNVVALSGTHVKRHAYALCNFIPALNEAARFYKQHHCIDGGTPPNMEETITFHRNMEMTEK
jgi:hypothetical protein